MIMAVASFSWTRMPVAIRTIATTTISPRIAPKTERDGPAPTGQYVRLENGNPEENQANRLDEQTEEETLALNLLDKIKIAGGEKASGDALYAIDRELEKLPDDAELAEDKTALNP